MAGKGSVYETANDLLYWPPGLNVYCWPRAKGCCPERTAAARPAAPRRDWKRTRGCKDWLTAFRARAVGGKGSNGFVFDRAMQKQCAMTQRSFAVIRNQSEFTKPSGIIWQPATFLLAIANGKRRSQNRRTRLAAVEKRYGVEKKRSVTRPIWGTGKRLWHVQGQRSGADPRSRRCL